MSRTGQVKAFMKAKCRKLIRDRKSLFKWKSMESVFSEIYCDNSWGSQESVSSPASEFSQTSVIRKELPILIKEIKARLLFDAPCGDFHWMQKTKLDLDKYIGADIVPDLITRNRQKYGSEIREFIHLDVTKNSLP